MRIAFLDPGDAQHERAVSELRPRLAAGEQLIVGANVYAEVMVRPLIEIAGWVGAGWETAGVAVGQVISALKLDATRC